MIESSKTPTRLYSQVDRILMKFGGASRLSVLLAAVGRPKHRVTIMRWKKKGFIPPRMWGPILKIASFEGVVFTAEDYDVNPRPVKEVPKGVFRLRRPKAETLDIPRPEELSIFD